MIKFLKTFLELKIEQEFDRKRWKGIGRRHVEFRHHHIHTFSYDEEIFIRIEFRTLSYGTLKNKTVSWTRYIQRTFQLFYLFRLQYRLVKQGMQKLLV